MKTFKEFITQGYISTLPATIEKQVALLLPAVLRDSAGHEATAAEALTKVIEVLQNDEFLAQLSDQLPKPTGVSSEEEFVDQASDVARRLLEKFLK
jgi:hypothetical protein